LNRQRKLNLRIAIKPVYIPVSLVLLLIFLPMVWAESTENIDRRVLIGLNFFPNVIAVDQDILSKRTASGKLRLLLAYTIDRQTAERLADQLKNIVETIKKNPVEIVTSNDPEKNFSASEVPCGIFLTEWLQDDEFEHIIRYAVERHIIVFSPFVGDVERGATAGIYISTKIRPFLNISTLKKSNIRVHELFRRLSKNHD